MKIKAPESISFAETSFCPGCGHGIVARLIGEVMEEMGLTEKLLTVVDVACASLNIDTWRFDTIMAAHGRPIATAIGVKKVRKDNPVLAYLGDGAAYSIGIAETMYGALRNDNVVAIVINNGVFGMTGGQMAPTTLEGQKTSTSIKGRDISKTGKPFDVVKVLGDLDVAYLARSSVSNATDIKKTKKYIRKAFEKHMNNEGYCLVEILSPCPTNLGMKPVRCAERVDKVVADYYKTGEYIDKEGIQ
ncbi:thiamine pyrophosphate-dependent enzyme [Schnuerera ultunensis]|uniref:2-oxoacid:ferredoxin oxidoreductase beta subunit n=1 Tax=[Clostridium] ultunense Esp TaxID=1288971 RepID=A0A1M4PQA3_9FIRM|nr:thiamine pyrophosphate-dependent enzyme [Schnuerera ultunensis]SHD77668.1 2-oxoacid:ferredoxin oxidoreductase beta subunit [[Clostridium] ultunense Esp]